MVIGVSVCGLAQLAQAIAWTVSPGSTPTAIVVVIFNGVFVFVYVAYGEFQLNLKFRRICTHIDIILISSQAPFAWLLGGEYPNSALRGYCFGFATALNFLGNFLGTLTAPYFINPASLNWGPKYGYIWFASNVIVAVFAYLFLPETRDRTLEEIHEMFENRVPARKFKTYVCVGVESYAAAAEKGSVQQEEMGTSQIVAPSGADSGKG